jgi:signal peptidase II
MPLICRRFMTLPVSSTIRRVAIVTLGVLVLDAATKAAAFALASGDFGEPAIFPIKNPDFLLGVASAAFPIMLAISSVGILGFGGYTAWRAVSGALPAWIPALLIGGGLGNLADRILFGAVHDWLNLGKVVVNLADVAVLVGLFGYLACLESTRRQS